MAKKGESILVTGGAGYLGSVMTPLFLSKGYRVTILDSFLWSQASLLDVVGDDDLDIVRGDSRDEKVVKDLVKKHDVIIPLAALVGAPLCDRDPQAAVSTNTDAVAMAVRLSSKSQKIVYPTTNSGYGIGEKGKFCTEDSPLKPISLYGRTKCEAEKIALDSGHAVTFRLATAFGASPRMRTDLLVNDFVYRAVTDRFVVVFEGHFKRNYIHVRDIARAFLHAIENFDAMKGRPYNVGLEDANLSKLELCEEIEKIVPGFVAMEAPVGEDPDKRDYIVSNQRLLSMGFAPEWNLQRGIRELVKAYKILKRNPYGNC